MTLEVATHSRTFTFEEAYEKCVTYFDGDELAAKVWITKYALKDSNGNLYESCPDDMHHRIASEIARIEKCYPNPLSEEEIFAILRNFRYLVPQGGPMTGIGNPYQIASLSNCFVVGDKKPADSYGGILKIDQEQVQLMKRRGGVGHDLTHIRPQGSAVMNSALTSTGVVPFMERYSNSTREVAQDGRRGALMLSISIKHPDAEHFINAKTEQNKITGANISVKIDDDFMKSVLEKRNYVQQFPVDSKTPKFSKVIDARSLWSKIVHNAWKSAEPGVLFWDTIIRESVPDCYADLGFKTVSTNPCGEIPLCPYDSCRLLAINLYSYVNEPFTKNAKFDFELFKEHSRLAQRIMDDIIDLEIEKIDSILSKIESDPEEEEIKRVERRLWENIRVKALEGRRTGIGITGEGDMHAALGLCYGDENSIDFSVEVHKTLAIEVYRSSVHLAKERGTFPIYNTQRERNNPFILRLKEADSELYAEMVKYGRRNIALLTVAPTGTTSLMTRTSSGIEPVFMPVYKRRRKVNPNDMNIKVAFTDDSGDSWEEYNVFHPKFITWLKINGFNEKDLLYSDEEKIKELVAKSPYHKASSNEINWLNKVRMQGKIQQWVDHSISATINLPQEVDEDLVHELYVAAWQNGCKGVTVYREGSRQGVLVTKKEKNGNGYSNHSTKRPKVVEADVVRFQNNNEKWIAFVGLVDGKPYEIFTGMSESEDDLLPIPPNIQKGFIIKNKDEKGNSRYDFQYINRNGFRVTIEGLSYQFNPEYWNYAKLISGVLRHGMPIQHIVNLVSSLHLKSSTINTWKNGVERALKRYIPNGTKAKKVKCDHCGSETLIYQEGCLICQSCGTSKCG